MLIICLLKIGTTDPFEPKTFPNLVETKILSLEGVEISPTEDILIWKGCINGPKNSPFEGGEFKQKIEMVKLTSYQTSKIEKKSDAVEQHQSRYD